MVTFIGPYWTIKLQPGQITMARDGSLRRRRLQHLTLFLGSLRGLNLNPTWSRDRGRAEKGVSIMWCDKPCPITTNNITSFNLYNTCIDPCGCYQAAITAQGWAQLSFRGCLNPPCNITGRQRDTGLSFLNPCPWIILFPRSLCPWNTGKMCHRLFPCDG